tara:strand:+ start:17928 stop:20237 length:2310 start_codon:yes stop_codon:yes gene_type:complete
MSVDIEKIFTPISRSGYQFLIANGQGCYIPAYQRPYSWKSTDVDRLLEDVAGCTHEILMRPDAIRFLGAIIAIHDSKYVTVNPIARPEVANRVMSIIDGQQRLSTFVLLNIAIHDLCKQSLRKLEKHSGEHIEWIKEQLLQLTAQLQKSFELDTDIGSDNYRYYPRIIRAYDDMWSRKKAQAHYRSPVAQLTWNYICHNRDGLPGTFKFTPTVPQGKKDGHYSLVGNIYSHITKSVRKIISETHKEIALPAILDLLQSEVFAESLWGFPIPSEVVLFVTESGDSSDYEHFCVALRLLVTAKVLNDRMAFTIVQAENEEDAFDIFEALNTTGEPLTPYETFKPKVIEAETLEGFEDSPSREHLNEIEEYLDQFAKAEQKLSATTQLLIPFALSETGDRLGKKPPEQRAYLRREYDALGAGKPKQEFLSRLANIATFMRIGWNSEARPFADENVDQASSVCFELLREMKHSITIASLSLFFGRIRLASDENRASVQSDFCSALKMTAAFSAIWRGAFGGTNGIDNHYRKIVKEGYADTKIPPLARRSPVGTGAVSLENYRKGLVKALAQAGISTKEEWVKKALMVPIYERSKPVARFLLFCASHDAVSDNSSPGMVKRGRDGISELLRRDLWQDQNFLTIEHVAPRQPNPNWAIELYEDRDLVNTLGNLTIMPMQENAVFNNRAWEHKRHLYRLVSAPDKETFDAVSVELKDAGLNLSASASEILEKSMHLKMCESIATRDSDWSPAFIGDRSRRIAELAWGTMSPWLIKD